MAKVQRGGWGAGKQKKGLMITFLITNLQKDISTINIIGIILGHIIFGVAMTVLIDWTWLKDLMPKDLTK